MQKRGGFSSIVAALLLGACATSGGVEANNSRFERNVGQASLLDAYDKSMKIIRQHQFDIERESQDGRLYLETRWRDRTPFEDEQALGIGAAQVRVIVRANPRSEMGMGNIYNVNIAVENRVQIRGSVDWSDASATPQYREWAQRVTEDLRRELDVGVRRYGGG
jgi:hypothetical protein